MAFLVQLISIGVSLRFGSRYLYPTTAVATGYLTSIVVVPLYTAFLEDRLSQARLRSERRAERHKRRANTDALTKLANRALLEERLTRMMAEEDRAGTVLLLELDGFKAVNDTYGHAIGDQVLIQVARTLETCVRASDLVTRLGGDEFCVLLHGANSAQAAQPVAEKIIGAIQSDHPRRPRCDQHRRKRWHRQPPQPGHQTPHELIHAADRAMYSAKRAGKNRYAASGE